MSKPLEPRDPDYKARIRASFESASLLATLRAELRRVEPGLVEIWQPHHAGVLQQHGFIHGGVTATLVDIAGGYAAQTLMGPQDSVMTIEFKVNMLAPAEGEGLRALGRLERPGKRLSVARMEVFALRDGRETLVAIAQGTYMRMENMPDDPDHSRRARAAQPEGEPV